MSGTSIAVSVDEKSRLAEGAVGAGSMMDKMGKKRTATEAGLDRGAGAGDADAVGEGREWVLKKVEEMERAFKEDAARNYVPPPPKAENESKPHSHSETLTSTTAISTAQTNGKSIPPPLALVSSTNSTSRAYIDPKTGLPSPTQPTIHLVDNAAIGDVDSSRVIAGNVTTTTAGKSPRTGGIKKSPRHPDPPTSASATNNDNHHINNNHLDSSNSGNNSKFPTGSAGDPIEIDDLDADVQHVVGANTGGADDVDMGGDDIVHLVDPPPTQRIEGNGHTNMNGQVPPGAARDTGTVTAAAVAVQPEGIGLGLGLAGLGFSGLGLSGFSDTSGTGELPAEMYGLQGTSNIGGAGTNDPSAAFGVDGMSAAATVQGGAGEQQISEEDLMKFFESLAPGSGGGGGAVADDLQAAAGGSVGDAGGGFGGEQGFGTTDTVENTGVVNPLESGGAEAAVQPQGEVGGMPEELDLSNLDWTQYSALLADIPDDLGGGA
ncbi:hypothetical protein QFC21_001714 [Naganishia friedmannii]|uniref:Uncharacterized protein n=1 Tax=Naganishia friedmannii TaxID=89922 RepID=A0ACC2W2L2_9TREE|nr:hypothetical protein QFC21_001714 [Naganishia friedmannii]